MTQKKTLQRFLTMMLLLFASFQLSAQAQWTNMGGGGLDIAIDGNNKLWMIGKNQNIIAYTDGANGSGWKPYDSNHSKGKRIAVDAAGTPYVVGMNDGSYKGTGASSPMTDLGKNALDIAADDKGAVYVIGTDNNTYMHNGSWNSYIGGKKGKKIAVNPADGTPYILGTDDVIYKGGTTWTAMGNLPNAIDIAIDTKGRVWAINGNNDLQFLEAGLWKLFTPVSVKARALAINKNDKLVIVAKSSTMDNIIWQIDITNPQFSKVLNAPKPTIGNMGKADQWTNIAGSGSDVAIDSKNKIWAIGSGNDVYHNDGSGWKTYANKGKRIAIGDADAPHIINMDDRFCKEKKPPPYTGPMKVIDIAHLFSIHYKDFLVLIGMNNMIISYNPLTKKLAPYAKGKKGKKIATQPLEQVAYFLGIDDIVYKGDKLAQTWTPLGGAIPNAIDIAADRTGRAWVIDGNNDIQFFDGGAWKPFKPAKKAKALDINANDKLAIVDMNNNLQVIDITNPQSIGNAGGGGNNANANAGGGGNAGGGNNANANAGGGGNAGGGNNANANAGGGGNAGGGNNANANAGGGGNAGGGNNANANAAPPKPADVGKANQWTSLAGSGTDVAIDGLNYKWAIGGSNVIYYHDGTGWKTYANSSKGKRIAADAAGTPYAVGMNNGTYKGTGTTTAMTDYGGNAMDIAVNDQNTAYVVGSDNVIYQHAGGWNGYLQGKLGKAIAVHPTNGTPYILGKDDIVYKGGTAWTAVGYSVPNGIDIAVDPKGRIWAINATNDLQFFDTGVWKLFSPAKKAKSLAINKNYGLVITDMNTHIQYIDISNPQSSGIVPKPSTTKPVADVGKANQWTSLAGSGTDVAIDGYNYKWTIGGSNVIYYHDGTGWKTYANSSKGKRIAADAAGTPYAVGMNNGTYKGTGTTTAMTDYGGSAMDIAVNDQNTAYVVGSDNVIYQHAGGWNGYLQGKLGRAIAVHPTNGTPYILGKDDVIYKGGSAWTAVSSVPKAIDIAIDPKGRVWAINETNDLQFLDAGVWKLFSPAKKAKSLDINKNYGLVITDMNTHVQYIDISNPQSSGNAPAAGGGGNAGGGNNANANAGGGGNAGGGNNANANAGGGGNAGGGNNANANAGGGNAGGGNNANANAGGGGNAGGGNAGGGNNANANTGGGGNAGGGGNNANANAGGGGGNAGGGNNANAAPPFNASAIKDQYQIKVKYTGKTWHYNDKDQLVSTRQQTTDNNSKFAFQKQSDGTYKILNMVNGKYLHLDESKDKLLSTRFQPDDGYTRFLLEQEPDGSYRIKIKAPNKYVHNDGSNDQLMSTRYQPKDDYTRFFLVNKAGVQVTLQGLPVALLKSKDIYQIAVKQTGQTWHYNDGDQLVSTRQQTKDNTSKFVFQKQGDGSYKILNLVNGKHLHLNESKDKLLSTHFQPDDGYTRFLLEQESDGSYKIKVKQANKYLHNDGAKDKLMSTRHQPNDDYIRFFLVNPKTGVKTTIGGLPVSLLNAPYHTVTVKQTKKTWHYNDGDQLVSTRQQTTDNASKFIFQKQGDGSYMILNRVNGKHLHLDESKDKLLSTRFQPNDGYTRFFLHQESDGSYRISVKAARKYLHNDGSRDQLMSTRYQPLDDYTRFFLTDKKGTKVTISGVPISLLKNMKTYQVQVKQTNQKWQYNTGNKSVTGANTNNLKDQTLSFGFNKQGDGSYTILNKLDGGYMGQGSNNLLQSGNQVNNFLLEQESDGAYRIKHKTSNQYLHLGKKEKNYTSPSNYNKIIGNNINLQASDFKTPNSNKLFGAVGMFKKFFKSVAKYIPNSDHARFYLLDPSGNRVTVGGLPTRYLNKKETFFIRVKQTGNSWHYNEQDQRISTRQQTMGDDSKFIFIKQNDGSYKILSRVNGKHLHLDDYKDKILATEFQPDDDYTRFFFEPEGDGSFRIKVKATGDYLHNDGNGDKLLSTRHQPKDDYTRFFLLNIHGVKVDPSGNAVGTIGHHSGSRKGGSPINAGGGWTNNVKPQGVVIPGNNIAPNASAPTAAAKYQGNYPQINLLFKVMEKMQSNPEVNFDAGLLGVFDGLKDAASNLPFPSLKNIEMKFFDGRPGFYGKTGAEILPQYKLTDAAISALQAKGMDKTNAQKLTAAMKDKVYKGSNSIDWNGAQANFLNAVKAAIGDAALNKNKDNLLSIGVEGALAEPEDAVLSVKGRVSNFMSKEFDVELKFFMGTDLKASKPKPFFEFRFTSPGAAANQPMKLSDHSIPVPLGDVQVYDPTIVITNAATIYDKGLDSGINEGFNFFGNVVLKDKPGKTKTPNKILQTLGKMTASDEMSLHFAVDVSGSAKKYFAEAAFSTQVPIYPLSDAYLDSKDNKVKWKNPHKITAKIARSDLSFLKNANKIELGGGLEFHVAIKDLNSGDKSVLVFTGNLKTDGSSLTGALTLNGTGRSATGVLSGTHQNTNGEWKNPFGIPGITVKQAAFQIGGNPATGIDNLGIMGALQIGRVDGSIAALADISNPDQFVAAASVNEISLIQFGTAMFGGAAGMTAYETAIPSKIRKGVEEVFDAKLKGFGFSIVPQATSIGGVHFRQEGITGHGTLDLWGYEAYAELQLDYKDGLMMQAYLDDAEWDIAGVKVFSLSKSKNDPGLSTMDKIVYDGKIKAFKKQAIQLGNRPYFKFKVGLPKSGITPTIEAKGSANVFLLGIENDVLLALEDNRLKFDFSMDAFNKLVYGKLTVRVGDQSFMGRGNVGFQLPNIYIPSFRARDIPGIGSIPFINKIRLPRIKVPTKTGADLDMEIRASIRSGATFGIQLHNGHFYWQRYRLNVPKFSIDTPPVSAKGIPKKIASEIKSGAKKVFKRYFKKTAEKFGSRLADAAKKAKELAKRAARKAKRLAEKAARKAKAAAKRAARAASRGAKKVYRKLKFW